MEKITMLQATRQEKERRRIYNQIATPYQPRIYYLNDKNVDYPAKHTNAKGVRTYNLNHWMLGNIIINRAIPVKKFERGYAVWYSIDGVTSHSLTKENYSAISGNFASYEILPPSNGVIPELNEKDNYLYSLRHLSQKDNSTLKQLARNALSILCRRSRTEEFSIEMTEDMRFFLERSIVRLVQSPKQIGDLLEHVIKEHPYVLDCGFKYSQNPLAEMRTFRIDYQPRENLEGRENFMDEKILTQSTPFQLLRNFKQMILDEKSFYLGRNEYLIKYVDGEWQLVMKTPAGNTIKTNMEINTLLYHISRAEKA